MAGYSGTPLTKKLGSSGVETDLSFDVVQKLGLGAGLVDNKICALDDTWSGLRFVYRLKDRKGMR